MYVFIVSVLCAVMLAAVRQMAYDNLLENIVVGVLLFAAIDSGLRAAMDKPSWVLALVKKRR
jgi:hypothetical protein